MPMMDRENVILVWVVVQELQRKEKKNILWLSSSTIVLLEDIPQMFAVVSLQFCKKIVTNKTEYDKTESARITQCSAII